MNLKNKKKEKAIVCVHRLQKFKKFSIIKQTVDPILICEFNTNLLSMC